MNNLHTIIMYYRIQQSMTTAPNGKQEYTSVHIRLEKNWHCLIFMGCSYELCSNVSLWDPILAATVAGFTAETLICSWSFSTFDICCNWTSELYPFFKVKSATFLFILKFFKCSNYCFPPTKRSLITMNFINIFWAITYILFTKPATKGGQSCWPAGCSQLVAL